MAKLPNHFLYGKSFQKGQMETMAFTILGQTLIFKKGKNRPMTLKKYFDNLTGLYEFICRFIVVIWKWWKLSNMLNIYEKLR